MSFGKIIGLIFGLLLALVGGGCVLVVMTARMQTADMLPLLGLSFVPLIAGVFLIRAMTREPDGDV
jgi:FtsH-binding integral membrane protein